MNRQGYVELLKKAIKETVNSIGRPLKIMEVCGTHTVAIFRHGIRALLPEEVLLISGPGCPVCVTSVEDVDTAITIAKERDVILATFGDMMRVPGSKSTLYIARSEGADVRVVYSVMDCLRLCEEHPERKVVFFGTGFETTSPAVAATVLEAERRGIGNFYLYSCHKLVPPAIKALLLDPEIDIDGFILPGHVSTIIGAVAYGFISAEFKKPAVITGFEGVDILEGILMLLKQIDSQTPKVEIQYKKAVRFEGNPRAVSMLYEVFEPVDVYWRGIGTIAESGLELKEAFSHRNARRYFPVVKAEVSEPRGCRCGDVLKGKRLPPECPLFGKLCTPEHPVGACMVSTEGSCAAYYRYSVSV